MQTTTTTTTNPSRLGMGTGSFSLSARSFTSSVFTTGTLQLILYLALANLPQPHVHTVPISTTGNVNVPWPYTLCSPAMLHEELSTDMVCIIKYPCFACKLLTNIILQDRITQLQDAILDASFHSPDYSNVSDWLGLPSIFLAINDHFNINRIHHQTHPIRTDFHIYPHDFINPQRSQSSGVQRFVISFGTFGKSDHRRIDALRGAHVEQGGW